MRNNQTVWSPVRIAEIAAEHPGTKFYRCDIGGADALAFENKDGHFVVARGSVAAKAHPALDTFALKYRELFAPDGVDHTDSFAFEKDVPYLDASVAARVVSGCPFDEAAWTAEDGTHPIVRMQSE